MWRKTRHGASFLECRNIKTSNQIKEKGMAATSTKSESHTHMLVKETCEVLEQKSGKKLIHLLPTIQSVPQNTTMKDVMMMKTGFSILGRPQDRKQKQIRIGSVRTLSAYPYAMLTQFQRGSLTQGKIGTGRYKSPQILLRIRSLCPLSDKDEVHFGITCPFHDYQHVIFNNASVTLCIVY